MGRGYGVRAVNKVQVTAIVHASSTDREGNTKLTFSVSPKDRFKAAAIAQAVNILLTLTVEERHEK